MGVSLFLLVGFLAAPGDATNLINRRISERWAEENVTPSPVAGDYEFVRRLSLDLRGVIPTSDEVRTFAANRSPSKREKLIDRWLRGEDFARYWADRWYEELRGRQFVRRRSEQLYQDFRGWLRDALRGNMPYHRFARRLLTSKGPTDLDPAGGYFVTHYIASPDGPIDVTVRTARIFLGKQIRCAQCHDHPFDDWTQADFYTMVSFFWQSRPRESRKGRRSPAAFWISDNPGFGNPSISRREEGFPPRYKGTREGPKKGETRRGALARLLIGDPQFARAAVNRHWGMLMGRGFIHPLDGFTSARRPSHPELLEELARDFAKTGHDVRSLLKSILMSKAYQLSSRRANKGAVDERLFSNARILPMSPGQLFDSLSRAIGKIERPKRRRRRGAGSMRDQFVNEFRPPREDVESADSTALEATISQALLFLNGELVGSGMPTLKERDPGKKIDEMFLRTVSRPPSAREKDVLLKYVKKKGAQGAYEDVFWSLLNSTEFVTRN